MLEFQGMACMANCCLVVLIEFGCVLLKIIGPARPNFDIWWVLYSKPSKRQGVIVAVSTYVQLIYNNFCVSHFTPRTHDRPFWSWDLPLSGDHFKHQKVVIPLITHLLYPGVINESLFFLGGRYIIPPNSINLPCQDWCFFFFFWVKPLVRGSKSQSHSYLINPIHDITIHFSCWHRNWHRNIEIHRHGPDPFETSPPPKKTRKSMGFFPWIPGSGSKSSSTTTTVSWRWPATP